MARDISDVSICKFQFHLETIIIMVLDRSRQMLPTSVTPSNRSVVKCLGYSITHGGTVSLINELLHL